MGLLVVPNSFGVPIITVSTTMLVVQYFDVVCYGPIQNERQELALLLFCFVPPLETSPVGLEQIRDSRKNVAL
jgi:hypothetical protein